MYRAIIAFCDLQDNGRSYEAGEVFPRRGLKVSEERFQELAGNNNRMGFPLIKQVTEATETPSDGVEAKDKQTPTQTPKAVRNPRRKRDSDA